MESDPQSKGEPLVTRTGIPKVLGVVSIIFGAFYIFSVVLSPLLSDMLEGVAAERAMVDVSQIKAVIDDNQAVIALNYIAGTVKGILFLVSGMLLRKYLDRGRSLSNLLACLIIVWTPIYAFLSDDLQRDQMSLTMAQAGTTNAEAVEFMVNATLILNCVLAMIFPVLCLVLLNQPKVKRSLKSHA